jgi:hypothetical protein
MTSIDIAGEGVVVVHELWNGVRLDEKVFQSFRKAMNLGAIHECESMRH